jgi:hypothetical protein
VGIDEGTRVAGSYQLVILFHKLAPDESSRAVSLERDDQIIGPGVQL